MRPISILFVVARQAETDLSATRAAIGINESGNIYISDRTVLPLTDGRNFTEWRMPTLRALLRGDQQPPNLRTPPDEYALFMLPIELHVIEIASAMGRPAKDTDIMGRLAQFGIPPV